MILNQERKDMQEAEGVIVKLIKVRWARRRVYGPPSIKYCFFEPLSVCMGYN
jgi:hypothetical protein